VLELRLALHAAKPAIAMITALSQAARRLLTFHEKMGMKPLGCVRSI
jgi:hypothetical protein